MSPVCGVAVNPATGNDPLTTFTAASCRKHKLGGTCYSRGARWADENESFDVVLRKHTRYQKHGDSKQDQHAIDKGRVRDAHQEQTGEGSEKGDEYHWNQYLRAPCGSFADCVLG
jgi:hypothetical protein